MESILMLICLLVLLLIGVPVGISLGLSGLAFFIYSGYPLGMVADSFYSALDSYTLTCVPLFILMGEILFRARVSEDLFDFIDSWMGHLPGGLGIVSIMGCSFFAAISGSSVANAATMGRIAIPAMISRGYGKRYVAGLLAAGGTLGILIPPSIPLIIFGSETGESIVFLFAASLIPGIALACCMAIYCILKFYRGPKVLKIGEGKTFQTRLSTTKRAFFGLTIPPIILGGIYSGIYTVTEAAGVGCAYSFIIAFFVQKRLKFSDLIPILHNTLKTSCMIGLIIAGATVYGHYITLEQLPQKISLYLSGIGLSPLVFLFIVAFMFIVMGFFLEVISIMLLTLPILYPIVISLGINPLQFAVIMVVTLELALITPPVGVNLYVIKGITTDMGISMLDIIIGVIPFVIIMIVFAVILILIPAISLFLPSLLS